MGMDANGLMSANREWSGAGGSVWFALPANLALTTGNEICVLGTSQKQPGKTYECTEGSYIGTVLVDLWLLLSWVALCVFSYLYVRKGFFAAEVAGEAQHVDYFGEAERYFPSDAAEEEGSLVDK